jgi:hypothetical protein
MFWRNTSPPSCGWSQAKSQSESRLYLPSASKVVSYLAYSSAPQDGSDIFLRNDGWLSELYDWRLTADQFVLSTSPLRLPTNNLFNWTLVVRSPYVTSSTTRGWVCRLQLLLVLASAVILRSESRGTVDHNLLSQIPDTLPPPNLEGLVPVFTSTRNRVAQLYGLHGVIHQKTDSVTTAVRTSNPTYGHVISVLKG